MSAHSKIEAASPSYDTDGYGWAMAQAQLLRERRFSEIDWDNVIEEIVSMGQSAQRSLESALKLLMAHLLKWEFQPSFRSRSWYLTIKEQHRQYRRVLDENPGLKSKLDAIRAEAFEQARVLAVAETGLPLDAFPSDPPGWNAIDSPAIDEADITIR